jgi:phosphoenolpyruvate carboxykinase (GTP)
VLRKAYAPDLYTEQFTLRIPENLKKLDRIEHIYRSEVSDTPQILFDVQAEQRKRLEEARSKWGEYVSPFELMEIGIGGAAQEKVACEE